MSVVSVDARLFVEAMSRGRAPLSSFPVTLIVSPTYLKFASESLRRQALSGVTAGAVTSIAMSEPGSGSDVASLTCRFDKVDGGYLLNGQKTWCSNAHLADYVIVPSARSTTPSPTSRSALSSASRWGRFRRCRIDWPI